MAKRDPETDQPLPDPQSFALWLADMGKGEFHAECSEAKQALVVECESAARESAPRTVKGAMTITFGFAVDDAGAVVVTSDIKIKHPVRVRGVNRFYAKSGNLVKNDPRQMDMPFREIEGGRAEVKEVGGRAAVKG